MQCSVLTVAFTEEKQKNERAQTEFRFINTITIIRGGNYPSATASVSALHCSKRRQTSRWPSPAAITSAVPNLKQKTEELTCCVKTMKINGGKRGAGGYYSSSRSLTASASAIRWQSTEAPSPISADIKMSLCPSATRAAAAACTQE
jgi:hypothetical protein